MDGGASGPVRAGAGGPTRAGDGIGAGDDDGNSQGMEYRDQTNPSTRRLRLAVGMLTPWRLEPRPEDDAHDLRQSTAFYPLVGLGIALLPAAALLLPLPAGARAALALALWAVFSAGGTLTAWACAAEAAFHPSSDDAAETRLRRLALLSAHTAGTIGAVALVTLMLGKWVALSHAPAFAPLLAAPLGRWAMAHALRTYVPAEPSAPDASLAGPVPLWAATWVAVAILGVITFASPDPARTALAVTFGTVLSLGTAAFLVDQLGGVNRRVCGAACEAAELVVLWSFIPWS